ncbi:MAG: GNAT family N-acetyltransferase [Methanocalculus sp. MSAO_Arc2]|uniref:GNAT family N-acetyltransferase n=1 Tax=Methanocalculus sp. MSAO_Arc2 TaxID=2293855 RepID=UPI000FF2AB44|nr:MAG: GNAT family N-acetyltransferase [Methanocalculus sp. MSAO_Arc2]
MEYTVRHYHPDDYPHICRIDYDLFGEFRYSPIFLRQAGELFAPAYYVATAGEELIGYVIGAPVMDRPEDGWILRIGVTTEWQGRGVGAALIDPLVTCFEEKGAARIRIVVSKRYGPVTDLLLSKGFSVSSHEKAYYYPDIDRIIMERVF